MRARGNSRTAVIWPQLDRESMDLSHFEINQLQHRHKNLLSEPLRKVRYPARLLRYAFGRHYIVTYGKPADNKVCEIGCDRGQMRAFFNSADLLPLSSTSPNLVSTWDAVDVKVDREKMLLMGYDGFQESDIETDEHWHSHVGSYDVVIMLHILEHLKDPERCFANAVKLLRPGGIILGGFPVIPHCLRARREAQLRKKAKPFGHISAFSVKRTLALAAANDLTVEDVCGAFMFRKKGFRLENYRWWINFNLAFGRRFKGWPGELYWCFRKST